MPHISPFGLPGTFFRGCLHVHSTNSDGRLAPGEVLAWYRSRGYDFVALTDHRTGSQPLNVSHDFITLAGIELDGVDPTTGLYHLIGLSAHALAEQVPPRNLPVQSAIDVLREQGALVALAHPYWSGQRSADLLDLHGHFALEVFNGGCEVDDAKGFSAVHWDDVLAAGQQVTGIAVDDAHWRDGSKDAGLGWVWVKAEELTQEAILQGLQAGAFYSSSGPHIEDIVIEAGQVRVNCSPVQSIDFMSNLFHSRRISAEPGRTLTEAAIPLVQGQTYVRLACRDVRGCWAWSNPVYLEESP